MKKAHSFPQSNSILLKSTKNQLPPPGNYRSRSIFDKPKIKNHCVFGGRYFYALNPDYSKFPGPADYNTSKELGKRHYSIPKHIQAENSEKHISLNKTQLRPEPASYFIKYTQTDFRKTVSFCKQPRTFAHVDATNTLPKNVGPGRYSIPSKFDQIIFRREIYTRSRMNLKKRIQFDPNASISKERRARALANKIREIELNKLD